MTTSTAPNPDPLFATVKPRLQPAPEPRRTVAAGAVTGAVKLGSMAVKGVRLAADSSLTVIGLGLLVAAAWTLGLVYGLAAAGVAVLVLQWSLRPAPPVGITLSGEQLLAALAAARAGRTDDEIIDALEAT